MKPTRRASYIWKGSCRRHNIGSALIALIAAILIFSVLAAALLPMVSSSGEQAVLASLGDRAYLLAEAGYQLAKYHYYNPLTGMSPNRALEALDDGNFTLSDGQGEFRLAVYSYYFPIRAGTYPAGTSISTNPPGRLAIDSTQDDDNVTIHSGLWLSIAGKLYQINATSGTPGSADDNVTFTLDRDIETLSSAENAYPATSVESHSGDNLVYTAGQGSMFPLRNGRIKVNSYENPIAYHYNNRSNHTFEGIYDAENSGATFSLPSGDAIVLNQSIRIRSTGLAGGGELETRRQVDYYVPGETDTSEEVPSELSDLQSTDNDTTTATLTDISGNQALAITTSVNNASLLQLRGAVTEAPLRRARRRSGGYLSYDAQVKLGFYSGGSPLSDAPIGIIPESVTPVATGLTFRLNYATSDTAYNGYGLSFMRADDTSLPSAFFSNIVPTGMNDQPLMVLWQQTGDGITWLAYKNLQPCIYPVPPNGFDDVLAVWIPTNNLWQISNTGGRDGSPAWRYVDSSTRDTTLQTPLISLNNPAPSNAWCDGAPNITLSFWCRERIELSDSSYRNALISSSGGPFRPFDPPLNRRGQENGWYLYTADLSAYADQTIRLQFTVARSPEGIPVQWDLDDVKIVYEHCPWPIQNSTLLVRLREAAVVPFDQGGPQPIRQGDWVYGATSGTRGRVLHTPLLTNTNWGANTAAGTLLLNRLSVNPSGFQANEDLLVVGRTGGIGARVVSYSDTTDRKVNTIKVYYASQGGSGAANGDSLDPDTLPYPRREDTDPFRWPPDEDDNWTAAQDYFRLVQWDVINPDNGLDLEALTYIDDDNRTVENAVIRSYDPDLQSPPLGQPVSTELSTHAYGEGTNNVYFDDFRLRLFFGTSSLFDTVLQQ